MCVYPDNQAVFTVEYDNYSPFLTRYLCPINKHTLSCETVQGLIIFAELHLYVFEGLSSMQHGFTSRKPDNRNLKSLTYSKLKQP